MSKLDTSTSLPVSWSFVPLKELGDWSGGGTPSKAKPQYWQGGTIPWVSPKDMKTERISDSEDHITKEAVSHSATSLINAGSVLIVTRSGILRHTLPVAVNSVSVTVNQDLKALTPRNGILAEYVAWALRAFSRDILHTCSKQGTTVNSVETSKLLGFEIPLAPRGQQAKIVAEIEKQFSRLDEAVANLKRVKANLKRYKASVLKAAVEGKLTEDWRKQHPNVESARKFLERILAGRIAKWNGKGKYKDPVKTNTVKPLSLPEEWEWTSLDSLTTQIGDVDHKMPKAIDGGIPYISTKDFTGDDQIDFDKAKTISITDYDRLARKIKPEPGDILLSRYGTVGEARVVPTKPIFQASYSIAILKPLIPFVSIKYLSVVLRSQQLRSEMFQSVRASSQPDLGLEYIRKLSMPLPSLGEQELIVAEVERRLSVIEELQAAVEANLTRADRLRQSILGQAFSGKLLLNEARG